MAVSSGRRCLVWLELPWVWLARDFLGSLTVSVFFTCPMFSGRDPWLSGFAAEKRTVLIIPERVNDFKRYIHLRY
jgi:hypothetical protein